MILRKINAAISLLTTLLLMNHAIFNAVWMLSHGSITKHSNGMSFILVPAMAVHAIISIILGVLGHKGATKQKYNSYQKLNKATIIQRVSGILLILFTALHVAGAVGGITPLGVIHAILPPLFFTITLMHVAVSTSKAFITLGIGNATVIKAIDISVKVICGITLIADVTGFYLHLC